MGKLDGFRALEGRSLDLERFLWDDRADMFGSFYFLYFGRGHLSFPHPIDGAGGFFVGFFYIDSGVGGWPPGLIDRDRPSWFQRA